MEKANLHAVNLHSTNLSFANLNSTNLSSAILLSTDLRKTKNLTQAQLEDIDPQLICNSPLPQNIKIDLIKDCDKVAANLYEISSKEFLSADKAKKFVREQRQKKLE